MKYKFVLLLSLIYIFNFFNCEQAEEKRKIKLAEESVQTGSNKRFSSTIHLEPTLRRAIAVMFFENKTGDQNLAWLQKGLTEMLVRSLSQSSSLSVMSTDRLFEILKRLGEDYSGEDINFDMAAIVAKEANVQAILTGNLTKNGDTLRIDVKVHDPSQGKVISVETVEGPGLDAIFNMVDDLSKKIKNSLELSLDKESSKGIAEISTNSLIAWRYYTTGIDFFQKIEYQKAIEQMNKAIATDSTFVAAYYNLCLLYLGIGEREKFSTTFQKLEKLRSIALPREQFQIDCLEGNYNRDIRKIINTSQKWLEQYPDDLDANFNLGNIYFGLENYDEAIRYNKALLEIDPKYKLAYNMLGYSYARKGDLKSALAALNEYQKLAPEEPNPYDSIGDIYLYYGDFKLAEKSTKQALAIKKDFIPSILKLGDIYLSTGEYQKALDIAKKYLEKASDPIARAQGYTIMGYAQWQSGNIDEAVRTFQKFVENKVASYRAITWVNELYLEKGDSTAAYRSLQKNYAFIKQLAATDSPYLINLANLSLWYDININETIDIMKNALDQKMNIGTQLWTRFYLSLLYLKANNSDSYHKIPGDFSDEFIEILRDIDDLRISHSVWKNYLIFNQYAYHYFAIGEEKYNKLIQYCQKHEIKMPEMVFRQFLSDLYFYKGDLEKAQAQLKITGVPEEKKWMLIGPYQNLKGFQTAFPPENEIKLDKIYTVQNQSIKWQHANDGFNEGYINLKQTYANYNWKVAYGLIYVNSPAQKEAQIRIGTNDAVRLWVNDEEIWRLNIERDSIFDNDVIDITLHPGRNKILIKVCNRINEWGYYFRITDKAGNGLPNIKYIAADEFK
ncbi:tetratricopeptide repeat protein [candidate division KSB1 bacterium]|nr:tetratricopeptide repeat protein [candidate division KSB1 bacterium]